MNQIVLHGYVALIFNSLVPKLLIFLYMLLLSFATNFISFSNVMKNVMKISKIVTYSKKKNEIIL